MNALVEFVSWDVPQAELTDRRGRPWDNPHRRPSHAGKRRSIAKQMLRKQFLASLPKRPEFEKIRHSIADLISLCAWLRPICLNHQPYPTELSLADSLLSVRYNGLPMSRV